MRKQTPAVYECDLSGLSSPALEIDGDIDDLGDLPIGWTSITISTRIPNPQYETVMQAKEAATQAMFAQAQITEADEEDAAIVEMMTDAQFSPLLESVTPFLIEDTELFVHPAYLGDLVEALGLTGELDLGEIVESIEEVPAPTPSTADPEEDEAEEQEEEEEEDELEEAAAS